MDDKRQSIIEATKKIIIHKGVENTTLSEVANQVGISKGTLYYYYPSKKELILDVADEHLKRISKNLMYLTDKMTTKENIERALKEAFENILKEDLSKRLHFNLIEAALTQYESLQEKFRCLYYQWQSIVGEGLKKVLQGTSENNEALTAVILTCLDGVMVQNLLGIHKIPVDKLSNYLLKGI